MRKYLSVVLAIVFAFFIAGCSSESEVASTQLTPVAFESGDECHLCGMAITAFPGPKGELFEGRQKNVRKFCSTRDLMSWYLQPENKPNSESLFVHDMAKADWNKPDDSHLIPAKTAWFVAGSEKKGAMGPTLASFSSNDEAKKFAATYGGNVLAFSDITFEVLNNQPSAQHHHAH